MIKIIIFLLIFVVILMSYINTLAEDLILTTYYPAPFGAYIQMSVGPGTDPPDTFHPPQPGENSITKRPDTLMRIGVMDDSVPDGKRKIPGLLEIGGIATISTEETDPTDLGLYAQGDVGICGSSFSDNMPAIVGYKPLIGENPAHAPAIVGMGSEIGVRGEGTVTGLEGAVSYTFPATYAMDCPHHYAIYGRATSNTDYANALAGVYGIVDVSKNSDQTDAYGVYGEAEDYGVYGKSPKYGVYGYSEYGSGAVGFSKSQAGIAGINRDSEPSPPDFSIPGNCGGYFEGKKYGIYAKCPNSEAGDYAGYFEGKVWVRGNLDASEVSANIKNFVIDHPVNKDMLLRHSCLEGPEAGIYQRGRVKLENKEAIIEVPDYFKALCKNTPTISLTPVGELALVSYKELEKGKRYKIFSDKDNIEVDWIIIAKREEIIVEEEKHEK